MIGQLEDARNSEFAEEILLCKMHTTQIIQISKIRLEQVKGAS